MMVAALVFFLMNQPASAPDADEPPLPEIIAARCPTPWLVAKLPDAHWHPGQFLWAYECRETGAYLTFPSSTKHAGLRGWTPGDAARE